MGEHGTRALLPALGPIDMALVGEPTRMRAAVGERGLVVLDCTAHGRAGHAARDEGINALYIAADDIAWLRGYRFERCSPLLGPIRMTATQIEAGTQHNVVPAECRFVVDVRTTDAYTNEETVEIVRRHMRSEAVPRSTRIRASAVAPEHPLVGRPRRSASNASSRPPRRTWRSWRSRRSKWARAIRRARILPTNTCSAAKWSRGWKVTYVTLPNWRKDIDDGEIMGQGFRTRRDDRTFHGGRRPSARHAAGQVRRRRVDGPHPDVGTHRPADGRRVEDPAGGAGTDPKARSRRGGSRSRRGRRTSTRRSNCCSRGVWARWARRSTPAARATIRCWST